MRMRSIALLFVVVMLIPFTGSALAETWRSETYQVDVTNQINTPRLDKGGTAGSWIKARDANSSCYILNTTTTTSHRTIPVNLNNQTMCSTDQVVNSGETKDFTIQWYKTDRSLRLKLSKNGNSFRATGNSAASFG